MQYYKDRAPHETIQLIQNYFAEQGLLIKEFIQQAVSSTWYVTLEAYKGPLMVQYSNGKGTTQEFALASGYAELYERYCARVNVFLNPILLEKMPLSLPTAQYLSVDALRQSDWCFKQFFDLLNFDSAYEFFNTLYPKGIYALTYQHITEPTTTIISPTHLYKYARTTGLATGNTFYEAFNQGMSEICERYVQQQALDMPKELAINILELNHSCLSVENQQIIAQIQASEPVQVHVYDMGAVWQLPVCCVILYNQLTAHYDMRFGSFPDIDIAVQRCLTELYQGRYSYVKPKSTLLTNTPMRTIENTHYLYDLASAGTSNCGVFAENCILYAQQASTPSDVYIHHTLSNQQIFDYFQQLLHKKQWDVYYYNFSQCEQIYVLSLYVDQLKYSDNLYIDAQQLSQSNKKLLQQYAQSLFDLINKNLIKIDYTSSLHQLMQLLSQLPPMTQCIDFFALLMGSNWLFPCDNEVGWEQLIQAILYEDIEKIKFNYQVFFDYLWLMLPQLNFYIYQHSGCYSNKELLLLFPNCPLIDHSDPLLRLKELALNASQYYYSLLD